MALNPTKTWEYVVNLVEGVGGGQQDRNERLTLALKRALVGDAAVSASTYDAGGNLTTLTSPWTVVDSVDGSGAAPAGTDTWLAQADIVYDSAGSNHSWIHLRQTDYFGSGDHLHLLIDCRDVSSTGEIAYVSYTRGATGYSGGTATDAPTEAETVDEIILRDGASTGGDLTSSDMMWGTDSSTSQAVIHMRISDDGKCGGWWVCINGAVVNFHGWQEDEEGVPARVNPAHVWQVGFDSNVELHTWAAAFNATSLIRSWDDAGLEITSHISQSVSGSTEELISTNNSTPSRMLTPAYIVDPTNNTIHGVFTDMWWGSTSEATGDQSPATPPVTRTQFGGLVVPWPSGVNAQVT